MEWVRWGSWMLFAGVALGAFGAHGLKERLLGDAKQIYQTGVLYHLIHALGLLLLGALSSQRLNDSLVRSAGWFFVAGIFLFSGSLYLLSVTGVKKFGMITPIGGLAFLAGWLSLALSAR
jgi:uncharacterized membrane protein YgdD (TMEM256/DUF423 family)